MKKTKILVPALGMMLLSTAAAVSGTMAWFSANRSVEVHTNDFAVEALDGSLTAVASNLVGTTADNTSGIAPVVSIAEGYKLLDASFDEATGKVYTDEVDDEGTITGYTELGTVPNAANNTLFKPESGNFYYAVAWNVAFSYDFKGDTRNLDLFFDFAHSSLTNSTVTAGTGTGHTYNGYRIAMINGGNKLVWAKNRAGTVESAAQVYNHVSGTTTTDITAYTNHTDIILSDTVLAMATDGANGNTARADYLGTLTSAAPTVNVTFVCWYEGTDADVINGSSMDEVSALMKFYVRTAYTGA